MNQVLKEKLRENIILNVVLSNPHFYNAFHIYTKMQALDHHLILLRRIDDFKEMDMENQMIEAKAIYDGFVVKSNKYRLGIDEKLAKNIESRG